MIKKRCYRNEGEQTLSRFDVRLTDVDLDVNQLHN